MALAVETVVLKKLNPAAGVPVACAIPIWTETEVVITYGRAAIQLVYGVDYTVALDVPDTFGTFSFTPAASLVAKVSALLAADPTEENAVWVRRELDYLSDSSEAASMYTTYLSKQHDRGAGRDQQLQEQIDRTVKSPVGGIGYPLPQPEANKAIVWNAAGNGLTNATVIDDIPQTALAAKLVVGVGQSNVALLRATTAIREFSSWFKMYTINNGNPEAVTGLEEFERPDGTTINEISWALQLEAENDRRPVFYAPVAYGGVPISHYLRGNKLTFSTNTAATDPGPAGFKFNQPTAALTTVIYVNDLDRNGVNRIFEWNFLNIAPANQPIRIRDEVTDVVRERFRCTGALTNNAGWWAIPVVYVPGTDDEPSAGGLTNGMSIRVLATKTDLREALELHMPGILAKSGKTTIDELQLRGCESDKGAPSWIVKDLQELRTYFETRPWFPEGTPIVVHGCVSSLQTGDLQFDDVNVQLETFASLTPDSCRFEYPAEWPRDPYWQPPPEEYYHMSETGILRQGARSELARHQGFGTGLRYNRATNRVNGTEYYGGLIANMRGKVWSTIAAAPIVDLVANFLNDAANIVTRTAQASTNVIIMYARAPAAGGGTGFTSVDDVTFATLLGKIYDWTIAGVSKFSIGASGPEVPTGHYLYLADAPPNANAAAHKGYVDAFLLPAEGDAAYAPRIRNRAFDNYNTHGALATVMPLDNTVPTIAEGVELLSAVLTTVEGDSKVKVEGACFVGALTATAVFAGLAVFRGSTCIHYTNQFILANTTGTIGFSFEDEPGAAAAYTYSVRVGPDATAASMYSNGIQSTKLGGTAAQCSLYVEELPQ